MVDSVYIPSGQLQIYNFGESVFITRNKHATRLLDNLKISFFERTYLKKEYRGLLHKDAKIKQIFKYASECHIGEKDGRYGLMLSSSKKIQEGIEEFKENTTHDKVTLLKYIEIIETIQKYYEDLDGKLYRLTIKDTEDLNIFLILKNTSRAFKSGVIQDSDTFTYINSTHYNTMLRFGLNDSEYTIIKKLIDKQKPKNSPHYNAPYTVSIKKMYTHSSKADYNVLDTFYKTSIQMTLEHSFSSGHKGIYLSYIYPMIQDIDVNIIDIGSVIDFKKIFSDFKIDVDEEVIDEYMSGKLKSDSNHSFNKFVDAVLDSNQDLKMRVDEFLQIEKYYYSILKSNDKDFSKKYKSKIDV
jgi:hypothetical protein